MEELCAPFGGREKAAELFLNALSSGSTAPKKIRRKDPCPCGSGKKYKNCHGKNLS
ncbi:MAG: SEC-C domain-containing protein [Solobacterium sp.]|nr:SEC-C domain-containing protein [Solobacterium sp.]